MKKVLKLRDKVLAVLAKKLAGFYLAGGTALSLFYFEHRESFDLDFFTQDFNKKKINDIVAHISDSIKVEIKLIGEQKTVDMAKMMVYSVPIAGSEEVLKLDFIEDYHKLLEPLKMMEGVPVLSLNDIYLRKIFTVSGSFIQTDDVGKKRFYGGRQEAKDFFDLYHLSKTFLPLSDFAKKFCTAVMKEGLVLWYRSYDRNTIKGDLLDIITQQRIDYREIERHFRDEIERIVKAEIEDEL